ncbi:3-deoxy-D-manno-octulosonic acid transferase [Mucilaginibacter sp. PPCGB 2223]|uniref:3-deoxy-D-manno-octulosonic acid transferase n=1 Tax=Mucilaginibacter sp. PPCGB 2223 TaxID=1886027 RepID=UPI000824357D|nr:glycosyltransferase N-terminal domain-containing protein [Mucilaginibacter sp. PPCGB 2223]OCX51297.1 3-deoxy-D-manno-octulosonic acid transferase [Mucilaginibacter sp. PPCGB 2223]
MLLIYNLFLRIYLILILISSFFNKKAKKWIKGRSGVSLIRCESSFWFHFASLGEFEQGRPVLEKMRQLHPDQKIVITFFSPSGYEVRKNTPLADYIYYLPLDTAKNARHFIDNINPTLAVFTKYEYWYHYFNELNKRQIPLYVISGIFRPGQVFFKWYGGLHRRMLGFVTHFFVQDKESQNLLQTLNITNITVTGDTRFDRVWENSQSPKRIETIEKFKAGKPVFIGGSTWPQDEELITSLIPKYPDWKFIFAPHEITEVKIQALLKLIPQGKVVRFSEINETTTLSNCQVLIIDNIGMLSSLYQYGDIAFIGGGFGAGIHNTLEAAAFGLPVIFGPRYQKFKEARDIVEQQLGFSVVNAEELQEIADILISDKAYRDEVGIKIKAYVKANTGATGKFLEEID